MPDLSPALLQPVDLTALLGAGQSGTRRGDVLALWQQRTAEAADFCAWLSRPQTLLGLIRRPVGKREAVLRAHLRGTSLDAVLGDDVLRVLGHRRLLFGLLRRRRSIRRLILPQMIAPQIHAAAHAALETAAEPPLPAVPETRIGFADALANWAGDPAIFAIAAFPGPLVAACLRAPALAPADRDAWVERINRVWELPPDPAALLAWAREVLASPFFDPPAYAARLGLLMSDLSAAIHAILVGDALAIAPSEAFDPRYYAARYPDIDEAGLNRLLHYTRHGHAEGRHGLPPAIGRRIPAPGRDTVLLVVHDASRTGAPILGWNIARHLVARYHVAVLLLGPGPLGAAFEALGAEVHGPLPPGRQHAADFSHAIGRIVQGRRVRYALVNSCESRGAVGPCHALGIRTVLLMHEFAAYVYDRAALRAAFDEADSTIFPAPLVAASALQLHPALAGHDWHVLPQGQCALPGPAVSAQDIPDVLAQAKQDGAFLVMGAGSVNYRKGVDLFIATAAALRARTDRPVHFFWVGHGYDPDRDMAYAVYLREQIARSGLDAHLTVLNEVSDLEPLYALADAFLLSSRLDPLPNVSIDAACRGLPLVCFRDASGMAELLAADPATAPCVTAHQDPAQAAAALLALMDKAHHAALSAALRHRASALFDMTAYTAELDRLGSRVAAET